MRVKKVVSAKPISAHPWMPQTKEELEQWINLNQESTDGIKGLYLDKNNKVSSNSLIMVYSNNLKRFEGKLYLPVQFGICTNFNIHTTILDSLAGCPKTITGTFLIVLNEKITSFDGITPNGRKFQLQGLSSIRSLTGIHKHIKNAEILFFHKNITSSVLGLLLINGIEMVEFFPEDFDSDISRVQSVLFRHLETKDILECQEQLIQMGLKEYAKL